MQASAIFKGMMHEKELVIAVIALASDGIFHHISCWLCPPILGLCAFAGNTAVGDEIIQNKYNISKINNDNNLKSITLKRFET